MLNITTILSALERAHARYVVVGGFAVILHGHLRATADLDLVIELSPENCTLQGTPVRIAARPRDLDDIAALEQIASNTPGSAGRR